MNILYLAEEVSGVEVVTNLNDRVERVLLNEFIPNTPENRASTVTDQCTLQLRGANGRASIEKLNRLFEQARRNPNFGSRVYLYFAVHENETPYRSRVVDGRISIEKGYSYGYKTGKLIITIAFEHLPYWEGAQAQIPLTNENGTGNTSGLTVYNTNDMTGTSPTKRVNYVKMLAANVTGDIPTPAIIEITNTYTNGTARLSKIWMGLAIDDATYPLTWYLDQTMALNTAASTEQQISLTTLNTAFLNGTRGGHFRVFTKCSSAIQDLRLNAALYFPASVAVTPMQKAPEVVMGYSSIIDLGTLQIPPWLPNMKNQAAVGLRIAGRRTGGFNITLSDIFLFPANAFRQLIPRGYGFIYTAILVDDGVADTVWVVWGDGTTVGHYSGYGDPIKLTPGKDQRLLFLNNTLTGGIDDDQTMSLKVYYRPRRLTP
jgi:hypothetical protein